MTLPLDILYSEPNNRRRINIIIGNGFDLNLGLPTSYTDYLNSNFFKQIVNNPIANFFSRHKDINDWVDIESLLITYSNAITRNSGGSRIDAVNEVYQNFKLIKSNLIDYINSLKEIPIDRESQSFKLFERLVEFDLIIYDFNYTDSVSKITDMLFNGRNNNIVINKVHGSASNRDIIFGVQDSADIINAHAFLKKSASSNYSSINLTAKGEFYIFFGHSIGQSDHSYFTNLFHSITLNNNPFNKIVVFYFGDMGFTQLATQMDILTDQKMHVFSSNCVHRKIDLQNLDFSLNFMSTFESFF